MTNWRRRLLLHSSLLLATLSCLCPLSLLDAADGKRQLPRMTNIRLPEEEGFRIYEHWTTQAFASVMSAFLQTKFNARQLAEVPKAFTTCYFRAQTVPPMAKCIVRLLRGEFDGEGSTGKAKNRLKIYQKKTPKNVQSIGQSWVGQFRMASNGREVNGDIVRTVLVSPDVKLRQRRETAVDERRASPPQSVSRPHYALMEPRRSFGLSPVGGLARLLMAGVLSRKRKAQVVPWQESVAKVKELRQIKLRMEEERKKWREFILRKTNLGTNIRRKQTNREVPAMEMPLDEQIARLVKDGIRIGMRLGGRQKAEGSAELEAKLNGDPERVPQRTADVLSPRFLSLTEARTTDKEANVLSPSLFSLHTKGSALERELSLPSLMRETGQFTGRDQQEWLDLIMEASGVNEQVDEAKALLAAKQEELSHKLDNNDLLGQMRDMFGEYEERKLNTWEWLKGNLTEQQLTDLNTTGFTAFNTDQLTHFYGSHSPYNDSEALERLLPIVANCSSVAQLIEDDVRQLAEMRSFSIRQRDVTLSPSVFRPTVLNETSVLPNLPLFSFNPRFSVLSTRTLSPLVFSPSILSPLVLGPIILSPQVFSPLILSPRVATPLILSPFIFSTVVLSPLVMQPFILSPGVLNSVIISPYVMTPFVLSPQLFHPFVLSPLVMAPSVLNPEALSPNVLSPFVLTPQIFSPKALSGLFLSPYAFSPVFLSPVFQYLVVLSPSFLS